MIEFFPLSVQTRKIINIAALLDSGSWSPYQKLLTAIVALAVVFDGFDIQILGFAIPSLMREWNVPRSDFGPILALGLAGMVLGSAAGGWSGDRFGRRITIIACVLAFGVATVATAFVHGFWGLSIFRVITGMGTGGLLPNVSALTAELSPLRRRPAAVALTLVCIPLGGMLGGALASRILPGIGWRGLYLVGGALPALFAIVLWMAMPESPRFLARHAAEWPQLARLLRRMGHDVPEDAAFQDLAEPSGAKRASVAALFGPKLARDTIGLWIAFFSSLAYIYLIFGWLPAMLAAQGLDVATASAGLAIFNLGGIFGVVAWAVLVPILGSRGPLLSGTLACAGSALALLTVPIESRGDHNLLLTCLAINGLLAHAVQTSMYGLAAYVYPTSIRATGVAYAALLGRSGGLLTSLTGYYFIQVGSNAYWKALAVSMVLAFLGLAWVRSHYPAMGAAAKTVGETR